MIYTIRLENERNKNETFGMFPLFSLPLSIHPHLNALIEIIEATQWVSLETQQKIAKTC